MSNAGDREEYEGYTVVVIPKEKQKPKLKKPRRY